MTRYERDDTSMLGPPPWKPSDPALIEWEREHGHDVRLECSTDYRCRLIDRDLEEAEAKLAELTEMLTAATDTAIQRGKRIDEWRLRCPYSGGRIIPQYTRVDGKPTPYFECEDYDTCGAEWNADGEPKYSPPTLMAKQDADGG